jgi:hypothetical protein
MAEVFWIVTIFSVLSAVQSNETTKLRVLKSQLKFGIALQCPLVALPNYPNQLISPNKIIWIDERNQMGLTDKDMVIVSSIVLGQSTLHLILNHPISDLSCGYYDQKYFRIKKWKLTYEDYAKAELLTKINSNIINALKYNQTSTELDLISKDSFNKVTQSGDVMQLSCANNFDLPLTTARIWLNYVKYDQNNMVIVSV